MAEVLATRAGGGRGTRLTAIIHEVAAEWQAEVIEMEVMPDHGHLLVSLIRSLVSSGWCG